MTCRVPDETALDRPTRRGHVCIMCQSILALEGSADEVPGLRRMVKELERQVDVLSNGDLHMVEIWKAKAERLEDRTRRLQLAEKALLLSMAGRPAVSEINEWKLEVSRTEGK